VSGGGFGGVTLLSGFVTGAPLGAGGGGVPESGFVTVPAGAAGADGGGVGGFGAAGAGAGADGGSMEEIEILDVSFFGT
jgi:hypothetical protein